MLPQNPDDRIVLGETTLFVNTCPIAIGQVFTNKVVSPNTILSSGFWGSMAQITLVIDDLLPEEFSISNAYPNPFNPTVNIDFLIPEKTDVDIQIFDLLGRNVFTHQQDFTSPRRCKILLMCKDVSS